MRKNWGMLGVVACLFLLFGGSRSTSAAELVISHHQEELKLQLDHEHLHHKNQEPGLLLETEEILLKNQTAQKSFEIQIKRETQDQWLVQHLEGLITIGEERFLLEELLDGQVIQLTPQETALLTSELWLQGAEMDNQTQGMTGDWILSFTISERSLPQTGGADQEQIGSGDEGQEKNRPKLPSTGMITDQTIFLSGCWLLGITVVALILRKKKL